MRIVKRIRLQIGFTLAMGLKLSRLFGRNRGVEEQKYQTDTQKGHGLTRHQQTSIWKNITNELNKGFELKRAENNGSNLLHHTVEVSTCDEINKSTTEINGKSRLNAADTKDGYVVISYDRSQLAKARWIHAQIQSNGYNVRMDVENLGTNPFIKMAHVVLVCLSQRYKGSTKCKTEAINAKEMGKIIIALQMEPDLINDGWLGILAAGVKLFDFTGTYCIEDEMRKLLAELAKCYDKKFEEPNIMPFSNGDEQTQAIIKSTGNMNAKQISEISSNRESSSCDTNDTKTGHVMISYDSCQQTKALWIKDNLETNGYAVRMDVENSGTSLRPTMLVAIENSQVVIICMSKEYKDSSKCESEATMAKKMGKTIIPIQMEKDLIIDGWLGIITTGGQVYDFTGKYRIEDKMRELLADLAKCCDKTFVEPTILPFQIEDKLMNQGSKGMKNRIPFKTRAITTKGDSSSFDTKGADAADGHVMISFDTCQQHKALWIKDNLETNGYTVKMNVEKTGTTVPTRIVEAIKRAHVVIVCLCQRYKENTKCKTEATKAKEMRKIIIALQMETDLIDVDWLSTLTTGDRVYDFTGKYCIEDRMRQLLAELAKCYKKKFVEPTIMPFQKGDRQPVTRCSEDRNCYQARVIASRRQSFISYRKGPIDKQRYSIPPPQTSVDLEKISDLSTHQKVIQNRSEKEETSQTDEKVEDYFRWLLEEQKELTGKEIQSRKDSIFRLLNKAIKNIHCIISSEIEEEKQIDALWEQFCLVCLVIEALMRFGSLPVEVLDKYRRQAGQQFSETKSVGLLCKVVTTGWQIFSQNKGSNVEQPFSKLTWAALTILVYFSYYSSEVARDIVEDCAFFNALQDILTSYRHKSIQGKEMTEIESDMVQSSLNILHNLSIVDENNTTLRNSGFVEIVRPYLDTKTLADRVCTFLFLANLTDENETENVHEDDDFLTMLLGIMETALKDSMHECMIDSAIVTTWDCVLAIHRLSRNQANKTLLVQKGFLSPLVKLAQFGTVQEAREAVGAIWSLALDKYNQRNMLNDKDLNIVDRLIRIKNTSRDKTIIEKAGATLRLLGDLEQTDKHKDKANQGEYEISEDFVTNVSTCSNEDDQDNARDRGQNLTIKSLSQEEDECSSCDYVEEGTTCLTTTVENQLPLKADDETAPTDNELFNLSRKLNQSQEEWWILAKLLGLSDEMINTLEHGGVYNARQYYTMLLTWKKENKRHENWSVRYLIGICDEAGIDRQVTKDVFRI